MLTAWMGKNSDFIHSYVPWMSFHRDRFKYHLKYKEKVFLKRKTALVIWPVTTFHSFSNVWYIQGILSLITKGYLCNTAWKQISKIENLCDTENKVRATLIRISENYVLLPFGRAKKIPCVHTHSVFTLHHSENIRRGIIWHLIPISMPQKAVECHSWDNFISLNQ